MKTMKEAAPDEVSVIKRRTLRSLAMGRISKDDAEYIINRLDEVEARIVSMVENSPETRREF